LPFAIGYAIVTFYQWRGGTESSYSDLRPYVQVTKLDFTGNFINGETAKGKASVLNSGKTPAINLTGCGDIVIKGNGNPMSDDFPCPAPENPNRSLGEISKFPLGSTSADFSVESPETTIKPENITTAQFTQMLSSGAWRVYFYGDMAYGDMIDKKKVHHTLFCGRYNPASGGLDICEKHNSMD